MLLNNFYNLYRIISTEYRNDTNFTVVGTATGLISNKGSPPPVYLGTSSAGITYTLRNKTPFYEARTVIGSGTSQPKTDDYKMQTPINNYVQSTTCKGMVLNGKFRFSFSIYLKSTVAAPVTISEFGIEKPVYSNTGGTEYVLLTRVQLGDKAITLSASESVVLYYEIEW